MNKKYSFRIIADPYLLILVSSSIIFTSLIVIPLFCFTVIGTTSSEKQSANILLVLYLLYISILLFNFHRYCTIIRFDEKTIKINALFKKTIEKAYTQYGYIYCASYSHFGFLVRYVVISQIRLDSYQLTHINIINSDKIIKVRMRRGIKEKLEKILPKDYIKQLKKQEW